MVTLGVLLVVEGFLGDADSVPPQAARPEIRTMTASADATLLFILRLIIFMSPMLERFFTAVFLYWRSKRPGEYSSPGLHRDLLVASN
jgi:hypothetical protein